MPAVGYPASQLPATTITPPRAGPRYPTGQPDQPAQRDPVTKAGTQPGSAMLVSGPPGTSRPLLPGIILGPGLVGRYHPVMLPHSGRRGHGPRLADRRPLHYYPPPHIP